MSDTVKLCTVNSNIRKLNNNYDQIGTQELSENTTYEWVTFSNLGLRESLQ